MKLAIVIAALVALMAPVVCVVVACPAADTHDCCPKSKSVAPCPLDILSSAKAAPDAAAVPVTLDHSIEFSVEPIARVVLTSNDFDSSGLYLANRVLRI